MDLMEEMWISRPQRRITKLSDLSDGGVIARIKFYNANKEYTVDSFKLMFEDYEKSIYCWQDFIELCQIINDYSYIVDYINNSHFRNELDIFTPEFDKKRTHHITSHKSDKDTLQVRVISNEGVIKSYDMSAIGITFEKMYHIIDKERNGYWNGQLYLKWINMITAEYKRDAINSVLDEYGLSREEFWKDPKKFLDNLDDKDAKLTLEIFMEVL